MGFIEKLLGEADEKKKIRAVMDKAFDGTVAAHYKLRNQKGKNNARIVFGMDEKFGFCWYAAVLDDDIAGIFVRQADEIEYRLYGNNVSCEPEFRKEEGRIVCDFILTFTERKKRDR